MIRIGIRLVSTSRPATPRHFYYTNDNVSGQVAVANVIATTAATDAALANPDPDWNRSWYSIQAASQLPVLSEAVVIDGYTQAGSSQNALADGFNGVLPR